MSTVSFQIPYKGTFLTTVIDKEDEDLILGLLNSGPRKKHICYKQSHNGYECAKPYACIHIKSKPMYIHRVVMNVTDPDIEVDHINGDSLDNRRENLRIVTGKENQANRGKVRKASSKYKGVHYCKAKKKWKAGIRVNQQFIHLGTFLTEDEAGQAYNVAASQYFKEFAKLNNVS